MNRQAHEARESLRVQRATLTSANSTLAAMSNQFPGIGRVVDAIQRRKARDNLVLGGVIASCICFTLWWLLH
jgi:golgi SNAP receptor complex member 1